MSKKYLLLFLFLITLTGCNNQETGCNEAGISMNEFNTINLGDSEFKVNDIVDAYGYLNDDKTYAKCVQEVSRTSKNNVHEYTYKYLGENTGYALITFTADYSEDNLFQLPTVSKKEQFNLQ